MIVQICVESSRHLKDPEEVVSLFQAVIAEHHLEEDVILAGSFCADMCNREGITVIIDDGICPGVTKESFKIFPGKSIGCSETRRVRPCLIV